jgi:hypothetical protein
MSEARRRTIVCLSKRFSSGFTPAFLGANFPECFGDRNSVYQRFNRWAKSGVFERIFKMLASDHDNEYMMLDATIVRAHQDSAGARKKTGEQAIGRSRGHRGPCLISCPALPARAGTVGGG